MRICKHSTCIKEGKTFSFLFPLHTLRWTFVVLSQIWVVKHSYTATQKGWKNIHVDITKFLNFKKYSKHNKDLFRIILENVFSFLFHPLVVLFKQKNSEKKSFSIIFTWKKFTYVFFSVQKKLYDSKGKRTTFMLKL